MVDKLKFYLRLKPFSFSNPEASFYRIKSQSEIQLLIPPSTKETFLFADIFYKENNTITQVLGKRAAVAVSSGINTSLICIGGKGAGKTYTSFGDGSLKSIKNSLAYSMVSELFDLIRNTAKEKNCLITVSLLEITKDVIRDLGLTYYKRDELRISQIAEILRTQDLEIKENKGKIYVDDAQCIQIINTEEVVDVISAAIKAREALETESTAIFSVSLAQRSGSSDQAATAFLVDLQSASPDDPRSIHLQKLLSKVNLANLNVKIPSISYKSYKLTHLLQNALVNSPVSIVANIDTDPIKFSETHEILKFCKSITHIDKSAHFAITNASSSASATHARRLNEEVADLNSAYLKMQALHEEKLKSFSKLIGIDNVESLLLCEKGSKEHDMCRKYREAVQSLENISKKNADLEVKAENLKRILNDMQVLHGNNLDKNRKKVLELKIEVQEAKERLEIYEKIKEEALNERLIISTENLQKMVYNSHFALEEKSSQLQVVKSFMDNNTTDIRNALELKELGKAELENEYKKQIIDNEYAHKLRIKSLEDSYLEVYKNKDSEILKSSYQCSIKLRELSQCYEDHQKEAVRLFDIARLQGKAIYDIEKGRFHKGICPVLIPRASIPQIPTEQRFPLIFSALGSSALETARVYSKTQMSSLFTSSKSLTSYSSSKRSIFKPLEIPQQVSQPSVSKFLDPPIASLKISELQNIGKSLQRAIMFNSSKVDKIFKDKAEIEQKAEETRKELEVVVDEMKRFQERYRKEVKNRIDREDEGMWGSEQLGSARIYKDYQIRNSRTTLSGVRLIETERPSGKGTSDRGLRTAAQVIQRFK